MLATVAPRPVCESRIAAGSTPQYRAPTANSLEEKLAAAPVRKLRPKEHLFVESDVKTHVYLVEAGTVLIYKILPDAKRQVIDIAFPGDLIGLGSIGEHGFNAQTTEAARVRCLPIGVLYQLAAHEPGIAMRLYEAISRELAAARDHMLTIGYRHAGARLAGFLLALSRRAARAGQDGSRIVLPMRRSDIADFLGLTIETVSRTFTKLKAEGVIDLDHGGLVEIFDPAALEDIAEGSLPHG